MNSTLKKAQVLYDEYEAEIQLLLEKNLVLTAKNPARIIYPTAVGPAEALRLLKEFYGPFRLLQYKKIFISDYYDWNELSIKTELGRINELIEICDKNSHIWYYEATEWAKGVDYKNYPHHIERQFTYALLKNGFYESLAEVNPDYDPRFCNPSRQLHYLVKDPGDLLVNIYSRYFLFKDYLEAKLQEITTSNATDLALNLLKPDIIGLFLEYERRMDKKYPDWKTMLISVAAFVETIWDKKYLIGAKNLRPSICGQFALMRYGIDIDNQLRSAKTVDRQKKKKFIASIFK